MAWFIKTEQFTHATLNLSTKERRFFIDKHKDWVIKLKNQGETIISGYLVDENQVPGGGGLLIIQADSYSEAMTLIQEDPMIMLGLVTWKLQEWIPLVGELMD
tara:strand:+ start:211 stop:519 length:309 start_codon:yes stop_codon:yes gene_type:complete